MEKPIKVLVTGVGGDLGQAIVKALRTSVEPIICHGSDIIADGVGSAFVDSFHPVPRADSPDYIETLDQLCCSVGIQAVVPGSEPEIFTLSHLGNPPALPCGVPIVCHTAEWLETYGDKLNCMQALSGKIDLTPFADGTDREAVEQLAAQSGFPLVVKSRRSWGSKSLRLVNSLVDLDEAITETYLPIIQGYIDDAEGEFSVGVFVSDSFSSALAFKRNLGNFGCSWYAETSMDKLVLDYVMQIARLSGMKGSANVQVRKSSKGIRLLEINARFSSLVAARAICGFRDLEWSLLLALGRDFNFPEGHYKQIRFRRYFHELIDFGNGYRAVPEWKPIEL